MNQLPVSLRGPARPGHVCGSHRPTLDRTAQPAVGIGVIGCSQVARSRLKISSPSVALDVQRCRSELDQLQAELEVWSSPSPPGLGLWRHKLYALIGEILDPNHALAIRLAGLSWDSRFSEAKQAGAEIIKTLRWELDRFAPVTAPFADATIDPELWGHVRGLVDARDWEKVAREAAVFVEDKLRTWGECSVFRNGKRQCLQGGHRTQRVPPTEGRPCQRTARLATARRRIRSSPPEPEWPPDPEPQ
jgi:hypothetical protein